MRDVWLESKVKDKGEEMQNPWGYRAVSALLHQKSNAGVVSTGCTKHCLFLFNTSVTTHYPGKNPGITEGVLMLWMGFSSQPYSII